MKIEFFMCHECQFRLKQTIFSDPVCLFRDTPHSTTTGDHRAFVSRGHASSGRSHIATPHSTRVSHHGIPIRPFQGNVQCGILMLKCSDLETKSLHHFDNRHTRTQLPLRNQDEPMNS